MGMAVSWGMTANGKRGEFVPNILNFGMTIYGMGKFNKPNSQIVTYHSQKAHFRPNFSLVMKYVAAMQR